MLGDGCSAMEISPFLACFHVTVLIPVLCGPTAPVLHRRPSVLSAVGCVDGVVAATLAHELLWTGDCRQDPCRRAADCRLPCLVNRAGTLLPVPFTGACMLLPVTREVVLPMTLTASRAPYRGVTRRLLSTCVVASW